MAMTLVGMPNADRSTAGPDHLLPPAARFFAGMLMGQRDAISQKDFSAAELAVLSAAVRRAEAEGRDYIGYGDYGEKDPWTTGNGQAFGALTDRPTSLANTLGMAKFKRMPDGTVVITDSYDFNASRAVANKRMQQAGGLPGAIIEGLASNGLVGVGNVLGNTVLPEGEGRPVKITLKPAQKTTPTQQGGRTKMADNFTDFYTGNMAPPLRLPGGGYAPAPLAQPQMTPEEIYEGIYGEPLALSSRSVKTVPVPMSADASARFGAATGMRGSGSATYQPPPLPNQPEGSILTAKSQDRLPQTTRDADILSGYAPLPGNGASSAIDRMLVSGGGFGKAGMSRSGAGSLTAAMPSMSEPVHQLNVDVADAEGQMYADNMGMPVRSKSGKVYAPKQAYTPKALSDVRATAPKVTASRGLLATLLSGLSNAPQQQPRLGNLLAGVPVIGAAAAAASPSPGYVTTPFQEDRFQTTTGAVMPSSMSNSRWTTGY